MCHLHAWYLCRSHEDLRSPGTGITDGCVSPRGCGEIKPESSARARSILNCCAISPALRVWILKNLFYSFPFFFQSRMEKMKQGTALDWATAETLALGSLLVQGKTFPFNCTAGRRCSEPYLLHMIF